MPVRPAPDDTEINQEIAEATSLNDALFSIAEKYGAQVTNNEPRWQDGVYLREVGEFIGDVLDAVQAALPGREPARAGPPATATATASQTAQTGELENRVREQEVEITGLREEVERLLARLSKVSHGRDYDGDCRVCFPYACTLPELA